jgi:hypothetical protein
VADPTSNERERVLREVEMTWARYGPYRGRVEAALAVRKSMGRSQRPLLALAERLPEISASVARLRTLVREYERGAVSAGTITRHLDALRDDTATWLAELDPYVITVNEHTKQATLGMIERLRATIEVPLPEGSLRG